MTWAKGCNIPRDDTSADGNIPYLHYGDLYKRYDGCLNLPDVLDDIIKIDNLDSVKDSQMLHDGDIVFTLTSETVDDLGHCTLIINPDDVPFVSGMETTILHLKTPEKALPKYLNYMFQTEGFRKILRQYVTGMKVYRVHPKDMMNIEINLPSVNEQNKIVGILDSFSDSISNLTKINDNLFKMLESEYNNISDNYPGEIELSSLCHIVKDKISSNGLTINNYYSTENMLPNKAGVIPAASLPLGGKVTHCAEGDVLISNIRPYFKKIHYCSCVSGCSADVLCFRSKKEDYSPYLYSILRSDDFFDYAVAGSKGTKMPRGDKKQIMQYMIPNPPKDVLDSFNIISKGILSTISNNCRLSQQLVCMRDFIIPKLMSNEIDISTLRLPAKYSFMRETPHDYESERGSKEQSKGKNQ